MPPARSARLTTLAASLLVAVSAAWGDVGATLSVQTDARDRGISYSGENPSAQLGLAWDGSDGWYVGTRLAQARFDGQRRGAWLQLYGGRVLGLTAGLDAEAGVISHNYENVSRYDFQEIYAGLLGESWNLRLYFSPDYYGVGQRSLYAEFNQRWPLDEGWAAIAHAGVLYGQRRQTSTYSEQRGAARVDLRLGLSRQLGASSELQLAWVAASRGGPFTWADAPRRRTAVLSLTTAF